MELNRCVLEVLKWLEVQDLLRNTSCVSRQWLRLSDSSEVWHSQCESSDITEPDIVLCASTPKLAYKELANQSIHNLVIVTTDELKLFDCRKHESVLSRTVKVSSTCSAVMVRNHQVFFTGGQDTRNSAFLYDFKRDQTQDYPNMLDSRRYHGSAIIQKQVFLFGGDFSHCQTAEKCSLRQKVWTWLPPLPLQRSAFTPCVQKRSIYLCGGNVSLSHVFHIDEETYTELPFTLLTSSWCIATWVQEDLVLENRQYRSKWRTGEELSNFDVGRQLIP